MSRCTMCYVRAVSGVQGSPVAVLIGDPKAPNSPTYERWRRDTTRKLGLAEIASKQSVTASRRWKRDEILLTWRHCASAPIFDEYRIRGQLSFRMDEPRNARESGAGLHDDTKRKR